MAGGRWQVAGGRWQVAGGRWQVAGGSKQLKQVTAGLWLIIKGVSDGATSDGVIARGDATLPPPHPSYDSGVGGEKEGKERRGRKRGKDGVLLCKFQHRPSYNVIIR